jgi:hypothetical protein
VIGLSKLKRLLYYDPMTGLFIWLVRPKHSHIKIGEKAGRVSHGYVTIKIEQKDYDASHLAWLWMTGKWNKKTIDHVNRDTADNRWLNLREATKAQNMANSKIASNNTSGVRGVGWYQNRWVASINGRYLGRYITLEEASKVRIKAAKLFWGEYSNEE